MQERVLPRDSVFCTALKAVIEVPAMSVSRVRVAAFMLNFRTVGGVLEGAAASELTN